MAPRATRSNKGAAASTATATATSAPAAAAKYHLDARSANPPKLFILPKRATPDARVVTLPHPRYPDRPARFLVCPESGVYEFTQMTSAKGTPRSWLIEGRRGKVAAEASQSDEPGKAQPGEPSIAPVPPQVTQSPDLYVASPFDPLFLVLPALAACPSSDGNGADETSDRSKGGAPPKRMFLTPDDHFDALPLQHSHLAELLRHQQPVRQLFTARMAAVCDTVDAGDESMYRLSEDKLLQTLLAKARRMTSTAGSPSGLPPSMEEKFVTRALEAPVLSMKSQNAGVPLEDSAAAAAAAAPGDDNVRTGMQAPDEVVALQRLRVAFRFLCASYVPPALAAALHQRLATAAASASGVDFAPLDAYLDKLAQMRQEAARARMAALDYTRKRPLEDSFDDGNGGGAAANKRKKEDEERRKKAGESRGVRDLKKVNVSGMKKMSDFFKKK